MAQRLGKRLLREYMDKTGVRQSEIARAVERKDPTVWGWLHNGSIPDVESAVALEEFTCGAVPVSSWTRKAKR
jgi:hypothetical protein